MDNGQSIEQRPEPPMANDTVSKFFGGSPAGVIVRLILVSILVGVILSALGLDPFDIVQSIERLIRSIWNMGFDAVRWVWRYFLLGAVLVIPIWIVVRLVNAPRGK
jgi:Na+/H+-dicarboxylate symporter